MKHWVSWMLLDVASLFALLQRCTGRLQPRGKGPSLKCFNRSRARRLGTLSTPSPGSGHADQNPTGRSPATAAFASSARPTRPSVPSSNSRPIRVTP